MSEADSIPNGSGDDAGASADATVCRDFLRNVCQRGRRCRYMHPELTEMNAVATQKYDLTFCHDFQNSGCSRVNCKFIHASKGDEEYYRRTGELSPHLKQAISTGLGLTVGGEMQIKQDDTPVCHDYMNGSCLRGKICKFRHISREEYAIEKSLVAGVGTESGLLPPPPPLPTMAALLPRYRFDAFGESVLETEYDLNRLKRRRLEEAWSELGLIPRVGDTQLLQEENQVLRRRVEELRKQLSDLTAVNEALLEQNTRLRAQTKVVGLTTGDQSLAARAPVAAVATYTSLSGQPLQARAVPHVPQQDLVATVGAAAPPTNPAPTVALAAETLAPLPATLSIAPAVTMAPVTVSVAPVPVSMAQGISMSHATTPMVTFPIASQSMHITSLPH
uniref:zinc finger CCCH domain-containing protein 10 isoform X1 n=1 Tax=Myxine glutinosa TaxID=7769 RepID=UPI0035900EAA